MNKLLAWSALSFLGAAACPAQAFDRLELRHLAQVSNPVDTASEIPAYDALTQRLFVVNSAGVSVDVWELADPKNPVPVGSIDIAPFGAGPTSVSAKNGRIAVAVPATVKTDPGVIAFFDAATLAHTFTAPAGALPDMVAFSAHGRYAVAANEGEPSEDYSVDPEGSVTIVDFTDAENPTVRSAGFGKFNKQSGALRAKGVRLYGPGASVAQDLEPEYVTITENEKVAYVALQENNAYAVVNLANGNVRDIVPFGYKDHSLPDMGMDASDRDSPSGDESINIAQWPVLGMYQPDAIATFTRGGQRYLVSANEGDAREWGDFAEESRIKDLDLDPTAFPSAATLQQDNAIGRLNVTTALGDTDDDGDYDQLYSFGARSFSIFSADGTRVFDSGDQIEQITAAALPEFFNSDNDDANFDNRSDNKGPEPEAVDVGFVGGRVWAFVGLERVGGILVYEITDPANPVFSQYVNPRFGINAPQLDSDGPEGIVFVSHGDSPQGRPLLIVSNEISGNTDIYQVIRVTD